MDLRDLGLVLARPAFERVLFKVARRFDISQVCSGEKRDGELNLRNRCHEPADVANVDTEGI